jgi:hypothetical protein
MQENIGGCLPRALTKDQSRECHTPAPKFLGDRRLNGENNGSNRSDRGLGLPSFADLPAETSCHLAATPPQRLLL